MTTVTFQEVGAVLAATFSCTIEKLSPTDVTLTVSTVSYSNPLVSERASTTQFWSSYHQGSQTVSVFTKNGAVRDCGRFETPMFEESRNTNSLCSRFHKGHVNKNSLLSLLANTAAEVAYFNHDGFSQLVVRGKYVKAAKGLSRDRGAVVKLVIADSRLRFLDSKPGEFVHITQGIRYTRTDKYEGSDIAAGTLIVFVTLNDPFPLDLTKTLKFRSGMFKIPVALLTNLKRAYSRPDECEEYIMELVRYVDLCTNPIIEGDQPDQQDYLEHLWMNQDVNMIMKQVMVGAEMYDPSVLDNVLGIIGAKINAHLDESLSSIATRLGFTRVP